VAACQRQIRLWRKTQTDPYDLLPNNPFNFSHLGSVFFLTQRHWDLFKSVPQIGHKPLQSSEHNGFRGNVRIMVSLTRLSILKESEEGSATK
jgi:hypothetical protein